MKLGQLIDRLAQLPAHLPVRRSDGRTPFRLMSWRGSYDELTLTTLDERYGSKQLENLGLRDVTVKFLLEDARAALDHTFDGYKGGSYRMNRETLVWADDWGRCDYWCIVAITDDATIQVLNRETALADLGLEDYVR